jgi:hypothetical protein
MIQQNLVSSNAAALAVVKFQIYWKKSSNTDKLLGTIEKMVESLCAAGGESNTLQYLPSSTDFVCQQQLPQSFTRAMK